jgi:hypothetical protein
LDAFVAVIVHGGDELVEEWRRRRNVEVVVECHKAIVERPGARSLACCELLLERRQSRGDGVGLAEAVNEVEAWAGDGEDRRFICVVPGKSIGHHVGATGLVLHQEVEVE